MAKGVFTTKIKPGYDDVPEDRYHFGRRYLADVEKTLGDTIVYYEPRRSTVDENSRGGRMCYFAIARPVSIEADPKLDNHFYCRVTDYLSFEHLVGIRDGGALRESSLLNPDGSVHSFGFQKSVRILPENEFAAILAAGLPDYLSLGSDEDEPLLSERPLVESITWRPYRDRAFKRSVRAAYDNRCAMTGLRLLDHKGRPEVQAAHIRPVAANGTDSVRNGLALSGTIHWLFDRGILSVADDLTILKADHLLPPEIAGLLNPDGRIRPPSQLADYPLAAFLAHHRESFKG